MKQLTKQKKVNYFGFDVIVPSNTRWLAVDRDSELCSHGSEKPIVGFCSWYNARDEHNVICQVDLEGMDWKDTLMDIDL